MSQHSRAYFNHTQNFFGSSILNPTTLARAAASPETWAKVLSFHHLLATDEYVQYLDALYREAHNRFGAAWWYLDIVNTLFAAAELTQPKRYLEIGVRRGRSVCTVARACPTVDIYAFDMWQNNYAGMPNPGPDFVFSELRKHGHTGRIEFVNGDSHRTVPQFLRENPGIKFDLITVDGDHSEAGAYDDLCNVFPALSVGGVIVFDDISHPTHPYLRSVWLRACEQMPELAHYEFGELGYGVAFGIRRS
jgi:predicted O-methyltransferase YrrM